MSVFRRVALAGASSLLALGALAGLTGVPASAQVARPTHAVQPSVPAADDLGCAAHTWCQWNMTAWFGAKWSFNYNTHAHNKWLYVGNAANDKAQSIDNNRAWITFLARNFPADKQWVCDRGRVSNLLTKGWPDGIIARNTISAIKFGTTAHPSCTQTW